MVQTVPWVASSSAVSTVLPAAKNSAKQREPAASLERRLGLGGMGRRGLLAPANADTGPPAPPMPGLMRLRCAVQHYEWGRRGAGSLVARLAAGDAADEDRPCAELWMGTHPSAPSSLAPEVSLRDWIAHNPAALGRAVAARWGGDLPFLFKVCRAAPTIGGAGTGTGRGRTRFVFAGAGCHGGGGGMDEAAIAALPRREVAAGDPPTDCAVCTEDRGDPG